MEENKQSVMDDEEKKLLASFTISSYSSSIIERRKEICTLVRQIYNFLFIANGTSCIAILYNINELKNEMLKEALFYFAYGVASVLLSLCLAIVALTIMDCVTLDTSSKKVAVNLNNIFKDDKSKKNFYNENEEIKKSSGACVSGIFFILSLASCLFSIYYFFYGIYFCYNLMMQYTI